VTVGRAISVTRRRLARANCDAEAPTSGAINPILTIATLALKAADHIHDDL